MTQVKTLMGRRDVVARILYGTDDQLDTHHRRELTSRELGLARRMARDPKCDIREVAEAIGWTLSVESLRLKLKKVNIRCINGKLGKHLRTVETRR